MEEQEAGIRCETRDQALLPVTSHGLQEGA